MQTLDVVILGLVQGLTEFLPVSSSGHLVAARVFFGISDAGGNSFDAFLHLGTLLAVLVYYWQVWVGIIRGLFVKDEEGSDKKELAAKLALATVPGAVVGYLAQDGVASYFRDPTIVAVGLFITAAALFFMDRLAKSAVSIARASFKDATIIGLAQVLALVPGISRSGITMAAGRARGLSRKQAATFSFLLSAPIIAGAGLSSLASMFQSGGVVIGELLLGFAVSFVSGIAAIYLLLKIVQKVAFMPFVVYLVVLAGVLLMYV